jgi:hypothetical protein
MPARRFDAQTQNGGRDERPPFCVCLGLDYFLAAFFAAFLAAFFTTFFAAFLVAIRLFSLSIRHRSCNTLTTANECIDFTKFSVKKNRYNNETFFAKGEAT